MPALQGRVRLLQTVAPVLPDMLRDALMEVVGSDGAEMSDEDDDFDDEDVGEEEYEEE